MKVLGIRCSTKEIRYAILEKTGEHILFVNKDDETKLKFPATIDNIEDKILWFKGELDRILRQSPDISDIAIKVNEFAGNETRAKREGAYLDCIALLVAKENDKGAHKKIYSQLRTKSKEVKADAERITGRTSKYWDSKIADAILCAVSVLRN